MEIVDFGLKGSGIGLEIAKEIYLMGFVDAAKLINVDELTSKIKTLAATTHKTAEDYKEAILQVYRVNIPEPDFKKLFESISVKLKKLEYNAPKKQTHKIPYKFHR